MSTKYTPAPWRVHHSHGYLVVESDNEEMFVQVTKGIGKVKDLANAYLIAAAPDLLEALQTARSIVLIQNGNRYDDINKIIAMADAAIAKALGETK